MARAHFDIDKRQEMIEKQSKANRFEDAFKFRFLTSYCRNQLKPQNNVKCACARARACSLFTHALADTGFRAANVNSLNSNKSNGF